VGETTLDTKATQSLIETKILGMPEQFLTTYKGSVKDYTAALRKYISDLAARGQTTNNGLYVTWKAFEQAPCRTFRDWNETKRQEYMEDKVYTLEEYLNKATVYASQLEQEGKWDKQNAELEALETQLESTRKSIKALTKKVAKKTGSNRDAKQGFQNPDFSPPKDGETTRMIVLRDKAALHKYCKKCRGGKGCWTKTHDTSGHIDGYKRRQADQPEAKGKDGKKPKTSNKANNSSKDLRKKLAQAMTTVLKDHEDGE
jgi:hypothetical protein